MSAPTTPAPPPAGVTVSTITTAEVVRFAQYLLDQLRAQADRLASVADCVRLYTSRVDEIAAEITALHVKSCEALPLADLCASAGDVAAQADILAAWRGLRWYLTHQTSHCHLVASTNAADTAAAAAAAYRSPTGARRVPHLVPTPDQRITP